MSWSPGGHEPIIEKTFFEKDKPLLETFDSRDDNVAKALYNEMEWTTKLSTQAYTLGAFLLSKQKLKAILAHPYSYRKQDYCAAQAKSQHFNNYHDGKLDAKPKKNPDHNACALK